MNKKGFVNMDRSVIRFVKEMQAGNEQAFTELYRAIYDDVFRMVYSHVHNQADAKDVTQEVFISLYHNIHRLNDPEAFPLWVQRVVFTRCTRLFRKRKDSLINDSDALTLSYEAEKELDFLPKEKFDNEREQELIHEMVSKLPLKHQEVINCVYFQQMSLKEAAQLLNRPQGTIKSQLYAARKELSAYISEYERKNQRKINFYDLGIPAATGWFSWSGISKYWVRIKSSSMFWKSGVGISTVAATVAFVATGISAYQIINTQGSQGNQPQVPIKQQEKMKEIEVFNRRINTPQDAYFALVDWGVTPTIAKNKSKQEIADMKKLVNILAKDQGIYWNRYLNEGWNIVFEVK